MLPCAACRSLCAMTFEHLAGELLPRGRFAAECGGTYRPVDAKLAELQRPLEKHVENVVTKPAAMCRDPAGRH